MIAILLGFCGFFYAEGKMPRFEKPEIPEIKWLIAVAEVFHFSHAPDIVPITNLDFTALKLRAQRSGGGDVNSFHNAWCSLPFARQFNDVGFASSSFYLTRLLLFPKHYFW